MNNRKYLLLLCLIPATLSAKASAHLSERCSTIPALRAQLATLSAIPKVSVGQLRQELWSLEQRCESEKVRRDSFLSRLSGFSPLSFYQRMNSFLTGFEWNCAIPLNEGLKDRFVSFADSLANKDLSFIFEPQNEAKFASFKLDLMTTANQFTVILLDALHIDMNEIYDVDALFSRIERGLASLTK